MYPVKRKLPVFLRDYEQTFSCSRHFLPSEDQGVIEKGIIT